MNNTKYFHKKLLPTALTLLIALVTLTIFLMSVTGAPLLLRFTTSTTSTALLPYADSLPQPIPFDRDISWDVRINVTEAGGLNDYVIFGEAPEANDGPPADIYDLQKPPSPPPPPPSYIRAWLNDSLSSPYDYLYHDYRYYPDINKVYNLTIFWWPSDSSSPTTVTLSWNTDYINNSEYDQVILRNSSGVQVQDMSITNNFVFNCPFGARQFTIECNVDQNPPQITNNSPSVGETGDTFTFNATVFDDLTPSSELLVTVNWNHDTSSENDTMTYMGGNSFEKTITLDESTSDLTYHFYANDTAKVINTNYTTAFTATIADDENPVITANSGPVSVGTGDSISLWVQATDNIGVTSASVIIDGIPFAMTWNSGLSQWEYLFTAPSNDDSDPVYTIQVNDSATNYASAGPYTITVNDDDDPVITSDSNAVFVGTGDTVELWVQATDNIWVSSATATINGTGFAMTYDTGDNRWEYVYTAPGGDDTDSSYTLTVYDNATNSDQSGPYIITVTDNDLPVITDDSGDVNVGTGDPVTLWVQATDNIGVTSATATINGSGFPMTYDVGDARWEYEYTAPTGNDGDSSYTVTVYDAAANFDQNGPYNIVVTDDDAPEITDTTTGPAYTYDLFVFSATITDNINVNTVTVEYWYGTGSHTNVSMTSVGGDAYQYSFIVANTTEILNYIIAANDDESNWANTGQQNVGAVIDNDAPTISNVLATPSYQLANNHVNITVTLQDNINIASAQVNIQGPTGFTLVNASMIKNGGDTYYYNIIYTIVGLYDYYIWTQDDEGNGAISSPYQFEIFGKMQITTALPGWNIISLPFNQTISKTDLIVSYLGVEYSWQQAFTLNIVSQNLWYYNTTGYHQATNLTAGRGYWNYIYNNCEIWATNLTTMISDDFITSLNTTWNLIGTPTDQTIDLTDLIIQWAGNDYNWSQATTGDNPTGSPLISKDIFGWARTSPQGYFLTNALAPGQGYWLWSYQDCILKREL